MKIIVAFIVTILLFANIATASYNASKAQTEVVPPADNTAVTPVVEVVATPAISNEPVYDYSSAVDSYKYSYARLSRADWISLHYEAIMTCAVTSAVFLVIIGCILLYFSKKLLKLEKRTIHIQSMLKGLDANLQDLKLDSAIMEVAEVVNGDVKVIPF